MKKKCKILLFCVSGLYVLSLLLRKKDISVEQKEPDLDSELDDDFESQYENFESPKANYTARIWKKIQRVKQLEWRSLKRSKNCRFICKPAVDYHQSGRISNFNGAEPQVKIMVIHCIRCLKSRGIMKRLERRRRRKRDLSYIERINDMSVPSPQEIFKGPVSSGNLSHFNFGKGTSGVMVATETTHKNFESKQAPSRGVINLTPRFLKRALLRTESKKKSAKEKQRDAKLQKSTKEPIVIGIHDENDEYINYYDDEALKEKAILDLENIDKKTQDAISSALISAYVFFAVLCMVIMPLGSFCKMCFKGFPTELFVFYDMCCCCRDPKYRMIKERCDEEDVAIAPYKIYKELMRKYDDETLKEAAEEAGEETATEDDSEK